VIPKKEILIAYVRDIFLIGITRKGNYDRLHKGWMRIEISKKGNFAIKISFFGLIFPINISFLGSVFAIKSSFFRMVFRIKISFFGMFFASNFPFWD
jgi:hypothetical protein